MPYLKAIDVDDEFVDEIWNRVSTSGSYYSIGDGVSKNVFRQMLFGSFVLKGDGLVLRLDVKGNEIEIHPMIFGPSAFRYAKEALGEVKEFFPESAICVIIPEGMRGAKRLAMAAGMKEAGKYSRPLSGVIIQCSIWR